MLQQIINRVINAIHTGLDQDLSLAKLAQVASFSPYHFQRMFKAFVGESPHDFITRLRLEKAVTLLCFQKHLSITEIAIRIGFTSPASFSRAFHSYYGTSPSNFRKNCKEWLPNLLYPRIQTGDTNDRIGQGEKDFEVVVKELPAYRIAYIRLLHGLDKGIYNPDFTAAFQKVADWCARNDAFSAPSLEVGVIFDHPDVTDVSNCRYDAGIIIKDIFSSGEGEIDVQVLPAGTYASIQITIDNPRGDQFENAIHSLGNAVDYLYRYWLPQSNYYLVDQPALDIYHTPPNANPIIVEHCLPVSLYYG